MSAKETNMTTELHVEKLRNATDQYIVSVRLLYWKTVSKNEGIYEAFCDYFQLFIACWVQG